MHEKISIEIEIDASSRKIRDVGGKINSVVQSNTKIPDRN